MKYNPNPAADMIVSLSPNQIFVFGSNESGIHGAGAARLAYKKFGAIIGRGQGFMGQSYGIPTKDFSIRTLPLEIINQYINQFIEDASNHPEYEFLVTKVGCGLAGIDENFIYPMFENIPSNVRLPKDWLDKLMKKA